MPHVWQAIIAITLSLEQASRLTLQGSDNVSHKIEQVGKRQGVQIPTIAEAPPVAVRKAVSLARERGALTYFGQPWFPLGKHSLVDSNRNEKSQTSCCVPRQRSASFLLILMGCLQKPVPPAEELPCRMPAQQMAEDFSALQPCPRQGLGVP